MAYVGLQKVAPRRHCKERSDETIHAAAAPYGMDCFASLAMTDAVTWREGPVGRNHRVGPALAFKRGMADRADARTTFKEVVMTNGALHVSLVALGVAAFAWIAPIAPAVADSSAPNNATPSLAEPAPTPVTTAPNGPRLTQSAATPSLGEPTPPPRTAESGAPNIRHPSHADSRHYARAYAHRYRDDGNPVMAAAHGVIGGVTTLGLCRRLPDLLLPELRLLPLAQAVPVG